jgi:hypothetical protein
LGKKNSYVCHACGNCSEGLRRPIPRVDEFPQDFQQSKEIYTEKI